MTSNSHRRVPHLRDGLIVAKVGLERSSTALLLLVLLLFTPALRAQTPTVLKLTLHDTIQPITALSLIHI